MYAGIRFRPPPVRQKHHPEGEVRKNVRAGPHAGVACPLREHHEGYLTVEEFDQNQRRLANNRNNAEGTVLSGPAREGLALLQGMLLCGTCGRAVLVRYQGNGGIYPTYQCTEAPRGLATKNCFSVRTELLDDAICAEVFRP
ncbi:zinc ribbon domain-containing protein [Variovorax sp. WS11]|uniref:zinc ribbon domain-containing protein n=1 Tax=Variovorax sp. WS11 TaxID=1105204 RepID=UPI001EF37228|nr:zinc ribbon domain-containing protein [Variovorax sp. WS11]